MLDEIHTVLPPDLRAKLARPAPPAPQRSGSAAVVAGGPKGAGQALPAKDKGVISGEGEVAMQPRCGDGGPQASPAPVAVRAPHMAGSGGARSASEAGAGGHVQGGETGAETEGDTEAWPQAVAVAAAEAETGDGARVEGAGVPGMGSGS